MSVKAIFLILIRNILRLRLTEGYSLGGGGGVCESNLLF